MPNKKTYAAYARDDDLRLNSSSGAIFSVIANKVLSNGGIVYGVSLSDDCRQAEFIRIDTLKDLSKIRGSKYVQAKIGNTFLKIKNDLEQKKQVLVSGTCIFRKNCVYYA